MADTIHIIAGLIEEFGPLLILIVAIIVIQYKDKMYYKEILEEDHKDLEDTINKRMNTMENSINQIHSQLVILTSSLMNKEGETEKTLLTSYLAEILNPEESEGKESEVSRKEQKGSR